MDYLVIDGFDPQAKNQIEISSDLVREEVIDFTMVYYRREIILGEIIKFYLTNTNSKCQLYACSKGHCIHIII